MGPSNDMGFTWGHYESRAKDSNGQPIVSSRPLHHHLEES